MNNIKYSNIKYEIIESTDAIKNLVDTFFDDIFIANDLDSLDVIESHVNDGCDFILFSLDTIPCALVLIGAKDGCRREIILIEVSDKNDLRSLGIGRYVVNVLKNEIYPDVTLIGYSVPEASTFWTKVAKDYDGEMYSWIQDGYDEDEEEYTNYGLMRFEL